MREQRLVAKVAIDSPLPQLDHLFDYSIPDSLAERAVRGARVKVPLRSAGRLANGFIVELAETSEFAGTLVPIDDVISPVGVLTPEVWRLARAVADRAAGTASDVLRLAIPGRQVRVERAWVDREPQDSVVPPAPAVEGYTNELLGELASGGRIAMDAIPHLRRLGSGETVGHFAVTMAQLATATVARGKSAILIVPDFRDIGQVVAALADTGLESTRVSRVDAGQSNAERYRGFLECLDGEPRVIVGNRSAVYAPSARLGLIALWDDGDPSHREPLAPYVHSRDAALLRQRLSGAGLVFAGHSRSTEVERLVEMGYLTARVPERRFRPRIIVTEHQAEHEVTAAAGRIPSAAWRQASEALQSGPVLIQVARPGYAPVLACARCQTAARCTVCNGPLGLAARGGRPSCGWCGAIATEWHCSECESTSFRFVSRGAGRTAEELGRAFPGKRVVVADGERPVVSLPDAPALVVATPGAEPVPAGGYRAVLLLDGDRMLAAESLRIAEDCLRRWSNAAALAATGAPVMLVGVAGPLADAFATWSQPAYAAAELDDRRTLRFPPAVRMASVTGTGTAVEAALSPFRNLGGVDVLGPVTTDDGLRAIVRFDYARGSEVADELKSAIVRNATSRRKRPQDKGGYRPPPTLRVRFDDPEIQI